MCIILIDLYMLYVLLPTLIYLTCFFLHHAHVGIPTYIRLLAINGIFTLIIYAHTSQNDKQWTNEICTNGLDEPKYKKKHRYIVRRYFPFVLCVPSFHMFYSWWDSSIIRCIFPIDVWSAILYIADGFSWINEIKIEIKRS